MRGGLWLIVVLAVAAPAFAQPRGLPQDSNEIVPLSNVRMRDVCILPDEATGTYYMVGSGWNSVRVYTSKDLKSWQGPKTVFRTPPNLWGDIRIVGIWAPEMHKYQGKYYLFLTFDTRNQLPEQWRDWLPRVTRGSQVLVGDSPFGPFQPFQDRSTLPPDMMTLDGTLWVEDGVPYMVYCHEWVQTVDGTVEMIQLLDDLSDVVGEPTVLFHGSDAPWGTGSRTYPGSYVTDGPYLYRTRADRLLMTWSSFANGAYTTGIAISESGRLRGPWRQQAEPLFTDDGGHGMTFRRFDGGLMFVLHQPNRPPNERARLFELEDTGDTIRIVKSYPN